ITISIVIPIPVSIIVSITISIVIPIPVTGMDNGAESTGDLHLLRDGPAECEDKCMGLSDESPDDDSDVVGGYQVDTLHRGALLGG
ncbi:hypothetical protein Tco_0547259, partial [Tanacetum coccineum]